MVSVSFNHSFAMVSFSRISLVFLVSYRELFGIAISDTKDTNENPLKDNNSVKQSKGGTKGVFLPWAAGIFITHYMVRNDFRCGNTDRIGNTDVVSEKTDVVSVFPMWYRKKPMWYRYFRCGIGIFPLRAFSDTTSEIISNRVCRFYNCHSY
jgi:hypothetical protein